MEETKTLQEEYSPTDAKREKVRRVAVAMIDDFPEHPFKVKDDEEMEKLKDSISLYGVLTPVVARRCENGRYELISGHRRKYACKALGIEFMPAIVREMSREEAVIAMVDSNLQREHILPSEKAFAYKMMMKMESDGVRMTFRFAEQEPETDVKENIVNILTSQFIRRTVSAP